MSLFSFDPVDRRAFPFVGRHHKTDWRDQCPCGVEPFKATITMMMTAPTHTLGRSRGPCPSLLLLALLLRAVESSPSSSYRNAYIDSSGNAVNASRGGFSPLLPDDVLERKLRMQERRDRAREFLKNNPPPPPARKQLEKVEEEELRRLGWFGGGSSSTDLYSSGFLADPSGDYDKWAQAYRMLGGMIDCDHVKDEGSHDRNHNGNDNDNGDKKACSRWMLWAAVRLPIAHLP